MLGSQRQMKRAGSSLWEAWKLNKMPNMAQHGSATPALRLQGCRVCCDKLTGIIIISCRLGGYQPCESSTASNTALWKHFGSRLQKIIQKPSFEEAFQLEEALLFVAPAAWGAALFLVPSYQAQGPAAIRVTRVMRRS